MSDKEIEISKTRHDITTFKARIKASKPHFLQKVMAHKVVIEDALKPHFCTSVTVFVPKLKPTQRVPVIMLSISNGASSVLLRCANPHQLAEYFRMLAEVITSDAWLSKWDTLEKISDGLEIGDMEKYMDVFDFEKINVPEFNVDISKIDQKSINLPTDPAKLTTIFDKEELRDRRDDKDVKSTAPQALLDNLKNLTNSVPEREPSEPEE